MRIVHFLLFFILSSIFASFNLENQYSTLGSSSIKTESLKQNFLSEPLESLVNPDEHTLDQVTVFILILLLQTRL